MIVPTIAIHAVVIRSPAEGGDVLRAGAGCAEAWEDVGDGEVGGDTGERHRADVVGLQGVVQTRLVEGTDRALDDFEVARLRVEFGSQLAAFGLDRDARALDPDVN